MIIYSTTSLWCWSMNYICKLKYYGMALTIRRLSVIKIYLLRPIFGSKIYCLLFSKLPCFALKVKHKVYWSIKLLSVNHDSLIKYSGDNNFVIYIIWKCLNIWNRTSQFRVRSIYRVVKCVDMMFSFSRKVAFSQYCKKVPHISSQTASISNHIITIWSHNKSFFFFIKRLMDVRAEKMLYILQELPFSRKKNSFVHKWYSKTDY